MSVFSDGMFDSSQYARSVMLKRNPEEASSFLTELHERWVRCGTMLQDHVFQHYSQFIRTSQEISTLDASMTDVEKHVQSLSRILRDLHSVTFSSPPPTPTRSTHQSLPPLVSPEDDLAMAVTRRDFPTAVDLLEQQPETTKHHAASISSLLLAELRNPRMRSGDILRTVRLLTKLGRGSDAIRTYLRARTKWIQMAIRRVKFAGDLPAYAESVSHLVVSTIRRTSREYTELFDDGSVEELVMWCAMELKSFAELLRLQVFRTADFRTLARCLQIVYAYTRTLEQKGLSLLFHLQRLLREDITSQVRNCARLMKEETSRAVQADLWRAREMKLVDEMCGDGREHKVKLTDSGKVLYEVIQRFVLDMARMRSLDLYSSVVSSMSDLLDSYFSQIANRSTHRGKDVREDLRAYVVSELKDRQVFSLLTNIHHVVTDLLPRVIREIRRQFQNSVPELEAMQRTLRPLSASLCESFGYAKADVIMAQHLPWTSSSSSDAEYPPKKTGIDVQSSQPSRTFQQLFVYMSKLAVSVDAYLDAGYVRTLVAAFIDGVALRMCEESRDEWDVVWERKVFDGNVTRDGLHQVLVDMGFVSYFGRGFVSADTARKIGEFGSRVRAAAEKLGMDALNSVEWFVQLEQRLMQNTPHLASAMHNLLRATSTSN